MFVDFHILNELGSPSINSNTFANRPPAGQIGRLFVSTDTYEIYRDNGSTWDLIGGPGSSTVTGTGAATQVAYWTASQAIGGSNNLWWDNTNGYLGVKTNTPTAGVNVVQTDGRAILSDFTTVAGSGNNAVAIYGRNTTNSSGYVAVLEEKTPNSSAGQYPIKIMHSLSSGTAAANMATGIHFSLPDDAGTERINQLSMDTVDPAAATYTSRYRFVLRSAGAAATPFYVTAAGLGVYVASPSGLIHADGGASAARMILDADAGVARIFSFRSDNLPRWAFRVDGAETGSNAGADLAVRAYNDAGAFTFAPLTIARATGKANWQATEAYSTGIARGNYFDYNLSVSAGGSFSSPNSISAVGATLDLTLAGNATIPSGARSGLDAYNTVSFTGTGTLTHSQGTQIRAYSNLTTGWAFAGSATGTITHLAGLRVLFPDNSGSAVTVTNNYGLLINDQTANTGTVTYTNRWGVYQEGASDLNYFAANTLIGTTVNSGAKLDVVGGTGIRVNEDGSGTKVIQIRSNFSGVDPAINVSTNNALLLQTNNTERVRITNGGLVGIGTSVPKSLVHVSNGDIRVSNENNSTFRGYIIGSNAGDSAEYNYLKWNATTGELRLFNNPAAFGGYFSIYTNAAERARFTAGGKLFLQTTNASSTSAYGQADLSVENNTFASLQVMSHNDTSGNFSFLGLGKSRGTGAAPTVVADGEILSEIQNYGYDGSAYRIATQIRTGVQGAPAAGYVPGYLSFHTNNGSLLERARIAANGNFLIGTTTDAGFKLDVNGTTRSAYAMRFGTYTNGDTTPTVLNISILTITNSSPTTITNFTNAVAGQIIYLFFTDSNTTINRNNAYLSGGVNFTSTANDTLTLFYTGTSWVEIARSINS